MGTSMTITMNAGTPRTIVPKDLTIGIGIPGLTRHSIHNYPSPHYQHEHAPVSHDQSAVAPASSGGRTF